MDTDLGLMSEKTVDLSTIGPRPHFSSWEGTAVAGPDHPRLAHASPRMGRMIAGLDGRFRV
jgi:hypothetical protein